MFDGQLIWGGVVSFTTVTVNWQLTFAPKASVAVHVTVVTPTGNCEPEAGTQVTAGGARPHTLKASGTKLTGAELEQVFTTMFGGHSIRRHASDFTVTVTVQVEWFPHLSVAVQVTVVTPGGKTLPDGGTHTTTGFGSTASLAVTV